ncbi:MAG TPA: FMN-binding protein [Planctomycetota bacterium]|nr:FMN-binding protein [Planctomycetota bacterium]HRR79496.1 FMN-binding protein [Planctomycetota bacterium]HRT95254.1 FMN-binding protein [Planctomycetota bacterium]
MTDTVRYPLVLGLISVCSAAGLAFSYSLTRDEIARQKLLDRDRGLAAVFGMPFKESDPTRPWREVSATAPAKGATPAPVFAASDPKTGNPMFAAMGSARGYCSRIDVIVSVNAAGGVGDAARIRAIKVVGQSETPGLGNKSEEPGFQAQFEGLLLGRLELRKGVPYRAPGAPDDQPIAAITGATITSSAVVKAVQQAIGRIRERAGAAPAPNQEGAAQP